MIRWLERAALLGVAAWTLWCAVAIARLVWRYHDARFGATPRDGSSFLADFPFKLGWTVSVWFVGAFVLAMLWWALRVRRPTTRLQRATSR